MRWTRMPWRGLRLRFILACGLLVATTIVASVWTLVSLSRLTGVVAEVVRDSDVITEMTVALSNGLEREDDALLLVLAGKPEANGILVGERTNVSRALTALVALNEDDSRALVRTLQQEVTAYRTAADRVAAAGPRADALVRYHLDANPLLRKAVATSAAIREQRFQQGRQAVAQARDATERARRAVWLTTIAALVTAVMVAAHLIATVVRPLRVLTRGANAIRERRFGEPIPIRSRDELGELASAFNHMAEDLAEFHRTNVREVVRAKATLEATLEALPDAVALFDAEGRVLSMNRAAGELFAGADGRVPATVEELRLEDVDLGELRDAILGAAPAERQTDLARAIPVTRDDAVRRLLPRVVVLPDPSAGRAGRAGALLLLYDVTELARLDEMRSELVAVASHELQTPLTTLRMTLSMLRERTDAMLPRERELIATALGGVDQLGETVHEYLDLTRIEAGELRLNLEPLRITDIVADAAERMRARADAQGIPLIISLPRDAPAIMGDARRLRSVLDNLLANALNHAPAGTAVEVAGAVRAGEAAGVMNAVELTVTDSGPGVPAANRTRIFEKFFRLEGQRPHGRAGPRGAGIGLYLCRQIVELHGGRITCDAGPAHRGARFVVVLPGVEHP